MRRTWDVAIAGAGPAGAALAVLLARRGVRVLLVDAARFPRDKVCGEFLSADVWGPLRRLGVDRSVSAGAGPRIERLRLCLSRAVQLETTVDDLPWTGPAGLSRAAFDHLLVRRAEACGADLAQGYRVRELLYRGNRVVGLRASGDRGASHTLEARARVVVAGDGRRSVVVRQSGRTEVVSQREVCGVKCHLEIPGGAGPGRCIEMHSLAGGYFGVCEVEDGRINLCGLLPRRLLRAARGDVEAAVRRHAEGQPHLLRYLDGAGSYREWLTIPNVAQQESRPLAEGVLYVGDACGTIEPLAGQGMALALRGALLAAELLCDEDSADMHRSAQARYLSAWRAAFRPQIARVAWLGRLFACPGPLAALVALGPFGPRVASRLLRLAYTATSATPRLGQFHRKPHLRVRNPSSPSACLRG